MLLFQNSKLPDTQYVSCSFCGPRSWTSVSGGYLALDKNCAYCGKPFDCWPGSDPPWRSKQPRGVWSTPKRKAVEAAVAEPPNTPGADDNDKTEVTAKKPKRIGRKTHYEAVERALQEQQSSLISSVLQALDGRLSEQERAPYLR